MSEDYKLFPGLAYDVYLVGSFGGDRTQYRIVRLDDQGSIDIWVYRAKAWKRCKASGITLSSSYYTNKWKALRQCNKFNGSHCCIPIEDFLFESARRLEAHYD